MPSSVLVATPAASFRRGRPLAAVAEAQRVSEAHGLTLWSFIANSAGVDIHLSRGNLAEASPYMARLEQLLTPRCRIDQGHYLMYTSWSASLRGEHEKALAVSRSVLAVAGQNAGVLQICNAELAYAQILQATGQSGRALAHASRSRRLGEEMRSPLTRYEASYREAWILFESGAESEGREHLRTAFALGREQDYARLTWYFNDPSILAKLCARALESGIEVDYALSMIRRKKPKRSSRRLRSASPVTRYLKVGPDSPARGGLLVTPQSLPKVLAPALPQGRGGG